MSYHADHLAWQQRVAQEFKAQNAEQETTHMFEKNGQWYNYPDLVEYLRNQSFDPTNIKRMGRPFGSNYGMQVPGTLPMTNFPEGQNAEAKLLTRDSLINSAKRSSSQQHRIGQEISSQYGYAPKSKVIYQRGLDTKSQKSVKSRLGSGVGPHIPDQDTKSQLSKANVQRFNEDIRSQTGPKSQVSRQSGFSKPKSQLLSKVGSQASKKPSVFSQKSAKQVSQAGGWKEDQKNIEDAAVNVEEAAAVEAPAEEAPAQDQEGPLDLDEAEEIITSVSQIKPSASQISKMSGKTYISQLQKQLYEEKEARESLEAELTQLKEISQEISSQLSNLQKGAAQ